MENCLSAQLQIKTQGRKGDQIGEKTNVCLYWTLKYVCPCKVLVHSTGSADSVYYLLFQSLRCIVLSGGVYLACGRKQSCFGWGS